MYLQPSCCTNQLHFRQPFFLSLVLWLTSFSPNKMCLPSNIPLLSRHLSSSHA
ncbi:hypothetical protein Golob_023519 [Gossypium lobatum]|uniref:Uncharacterized protein n=1 Tax=Gossypium lobatum TaxID=34289 RepID=A0A7J8LK12_9ROSI|nr:hypothetical protein [Gossypium lobatum]